MGLTAEPTPVPEPVRLPAVQATRGLLPPPNPLPLELLVLWAEAGVAIICCHIRVNNGVLILMEPPELKVAAEHLASTTRDCLASSSSVLKHTPSSGFTKHIIFSRTMVRAVLAQAGSRSHIEAVIHL